MKKRALLGLAVLLALVIAGGAEKVHADSGPPCPPEICGGGK